MTQKLENKVRQYNMNNDEMLDKKLPELMAWATPTYGRNEIQTQMHHLAVRTTAGLHHHNNNKI